MRNLLILFLTLFMATNLNAKCYKANCYSDIRREKQKAIDKVEEAFKNNNKALDELDRAYYEYNEALIRQNELLKQIEAIKKESLAEEKAIGYYLKKHNLLRDKNIDKKYSEEF